MLKKFLRVVSAAAVLVGSLVVPSGTAFAAAPYDYVGSGWPGYQSWWGNTAWYMAGMNWGGTLGNGWWGVTGYVEGAAGQAYQALYLGQASGVTGLVGCMEAAKDWNTSMAAEGTVENAALGYLLSKYAYGGASSLPGTDNRNKAANAAALSWFIHEWNESGSSGWNARQNYWANTPYYWIDVVYADVIAHRDVLWAEATKYAGPYKWASDSDVIVSYPSKTVKVVAPRNANNWTPPGTVVTLTATSGALFSNTGVPAGVTISADKKTATWNVNSNNQNSSVTLNLTPNAPTGKIIINAASSALPSTQVQKYKNPSDPNGNQRLAGGVAPTSLYASGNDPLSNDVSITSSASALLVRPGAVVSDTVSLTCETSSLCSGASFTGVSRLYGPFASVPTSSTALGTSRGEVSWSGTFNSSGKATVTSGNLTLSSSLAPGIYVWRETLTADPSARWVATAGTWPEVSEMFTVAAPSVSSQITVGGAAASVARPGDTISDGVNVTGWPVAASGVSVTGSVKSILWSADGTIGSGGAVTCAWDGKTEVKTATVAITSGGVTGVNSFTIPDSAGVKCYGYSADVTLIAKRSGASDSVVTLGHPVTSANQSVAVLKSEVVISSSASSLLVSPGDQVSDTVSVSCITALACVGVAFGGVSDLYGPFVAVPTSATVLGVSLGRVTWSGVFDASGRASVSSSGLVLPAGASVGVYVWREVLSADASGRWVETSGVWPEASEMFTVAVPGVSTQIAVAGVAATVAQPGDTISDGVSVSGWPTASAGASVTGAVESVLFSAPGSVDVDGLVSCDWDAKSQVQVARVAVDVAGVTGINEYTIPDSGGMTCYGYSADVTLTQARGGVSSSLVVSHPVTSMNQSVVVPVPSVASTLHANGAPAVAVRAGDVISDAVDVAGLVAGVPTGGVVEAALTSTLVSVPVSIDAAGVPSCDWSATQTRIRSVVVDVPLDGVLTGVNEYTIPDAGGATCYGYDANLVLSVVTPGRDVEHLVVSHPVTSTNQSVNEVWVSITSQVSEYLITPGTLTMDEVIVTGGVTKTLGGEEFVRDWTAEIWSAPAVISSATGVATCEGVDWTKGVLLASFAPVVFSTDRVQRVGEWSSPTSDNMCYSYAGTFTQRLSGGDSVVAFYHAPGQASQTVLAAWPSISSVASDHLVTPSMVVADSIWVANITERLPDGTRLRYMFMPEVWKLPANSDPGEAWCVDADWRILPGAELVETFPGEEITKSGLLRAAQFTTGAEDRMCYSYAGTLQIFDADDPDADTPLISVVHAPGQPSETLLAVSFNVSSAASQQVTSGPTTLFDSLWWTNLVDKLPDGTRVVNMFTAEVWRHPARYVSKDTGQPITYDPAVQPMLGDFTCDGIDWGEAELFQVFDENEMDPAGFIRHAEFQTAGENEAYCYSFAGWWHMWDANDRESTSLLAKDSVSALAARIAPTPLMSFYHEPGQPSETILVFVPRFDTGGSVLDGNMVEFAWLFGGGGALLLGAAVRTSRRGGKQPRRSGSGPRHALDTLEFDDVADWPTESYVPARGDW
jgi:hypothetical protein